MQEFVIFLFASSISIAVFYLIYILFLNNEVFFSYNRMYLYVLLILSFLIPLIPLPVNVVVPNKTIFIGDIIPVFVDDGIMAKPDVSTANSFRYYYIYIAGIILFGLRLIYRLIQLFFIIISNKKESINETKCVVLDKNFSPFSFFNYLFINPNTISKVYLSNIIYHEKVHMRLLHSFDRILIEIVIIIYWFNPFVWLIRKSFIELHEFQADRATLSKGIDLMEYKKQMVNQLFGNQFFRLASHFNFSLTKKRLKMIEKIKFRNNGRIKKFLILPACILVIGLLSFTNLSIDNYNAYVDKDIELKPISVEISKNVNRVVDNSRQPEMRSKVVDINKQPEDTTIYHMVETMPKFVYNEEIGDVKLFKRYIVDNLIYPEEAKNKGISGKVFIQFVIDNKGKVAKVKVIRSADPLLDMEALRVVKESPDWIPGKQKGKPVYVAYTFPIVFSLENKAK